MDKRIGWAALGVFGIVIGCGGGGSSSTSGGGGSGTTSTATATATATGAGGGTATSTSTGTATATSTGTTGAGGGGPGDACVKCAGEKVFKAGSMCTMAYTTCQSDMDCAAWLACNENCNASDFTMQCFAACDQAASAVMNLFQPVEDCVCASCKPECAPACP